VLLKINLIKVMINHRSLNVWICERAFG